jgi:hypothetical protein
MPGKRDYRGNSSLIRIPDAEFAEFEAVETFP